MPQLSVSLRNAEHSCTNPLLCLPHGNIFCISVCSGRRSLPFNVIWWNMLVKTRCWKMRILKFCENKSPQQKGITTIANMLHVWEICIYACQSEKKLPCTLEERFCISTKFYFPLKTLLQCKGTAANAICTKLMIYCETSPTIQTLSILFKMLSVGKDLRSVIL